MVVVLVLVEGRRLSCWTIRLPPIHFLFLISGTGFTSRGCWSCLPHYFRSSFFPSFPVIAILCGSFGRSGGRISNDGDEGLAGQVLLLLLLVLYPQGFRRFFPVPLFFLTSFLPFFLPCLLASWNRIDGSRHECGISRYVGGRVVDFRFFSGFYSLFRFRLSESLVRAGVFFFFPRSRRGG